MKVNDLILVIILVLSLVLAKTLSWKDKTNNTREFTFIYSVDLKSSNGKKVELAVKQIIQNEEVKNKDSLINPEALDYYKNIEILLT